MAPPSIILFGLRGSGKSTLGRLLAVRLNRTFIDLDDRVRAALGGTSVAEVFRRQGEPAFREAECVQLGALLQDADGARDSAGDLVIALGGGTPTYPPSLELLQRAAQAQRAVLILLEAPAEVLGARVAAGPGDRPLLAGSTFIEEARLLGDSRLPHYRKLAHAVVRTDAPTETALLELENAARAAG